jgi:hypothetical protein
MANFNLAPKTLTQTINPMSWWIGQLGFININETSSGDPAIEQQITQEVAGYGRQLGWISEALETVLRHTDSKKWPKADQAKLDQFKRLVAQVDAVKQGNSAETQGAQIDRLVAAVEDLKRSDRAVFDTVAIRLRNVIGEGDATPAPTKPAPTKPASTNKKARSRRA